MGLRRFLERTSIFLVVMFLYVSGEDNIVVRTKNDQISLLSFMKDIVSDPEHVLENWNSSGLHVCNWTGVGCNLARNRVIQLDLNGRSLGGIISLSLANLSSLVVLDLSKNFFSGWIPGELHQLFKLKQLSLSSNLLEGDVPGIFSSLHRLVYLDLASNRFTGQLPASLFCNGSSMLEYIDLSNNSFSGVIPWRRRCQLTELKYFLLWSNRLVGQIPRALSNSTKLEWLDVEANLLTGDLPSDILDKMPKLQYLYLSDNNFASANGNTDLNPFFSSLTKCSNLQELDLAGNKLGGEVPDTIGHLSTRLLQINLEDNLIYGSIPRTILSLVNLTLLNMSSNLLNGSIPSEMFKMRKLERVYLSNNLLSGEIPSHFGDISHLGLLDLSQNRLVGSIPDTISNLSQLRKLLLYDNQLSGTIPPSLGKCNNLEILDLSNNRISGEIPNEVAGLGSLKLYLNLSRNFLEGSIPLQMGQMVMVQAIDLSSNNLSGEISAQLGSCIALEYLNLSSNRLQGQLPTQIGNLPYLEVLDISYNNFSGTLPKEGVFESMTLDSLQGNTGLCGQISGMPSCFIKKKKRRSIIVPVILTLLTTPILCLFGYPLVLKIRARRLPGIFGEDEEEEKGRSKYPRISYRQLHQATGGFNSSSLIGSGTFGHVYKGALRDDTRIAVKVLDSTMGGEIPGASFKRECQVLKRTRHRNLMRIITACSKPDFKALVLPLMSNGSLESRLYPVQDSGQGLSLVQLVRICSNIAEGVAYLHHDSPIRVIHCDLKPSNILLDDDMNALVSDFGIATLVKGGGGQNTTVFDSSTFSSTAGLLCGSVGYIAPEYGLGGISSTQGDVYSYGVLLLEIITGKRPTNVLFHEGSSLHQWVKSRHPHNLQLIVREALLKSPMPSNINSVSSNKIRLDVIIEMIDLGLLCTQYTPSMRPSMIDIAHKMGWLKEHISNPPFLIIDEDFPEIDNSG
ncbi:hypothetical protein GIB67_007900 [Kingdonia uniflora]|uniref:non-specific serine/threonine protein kinase n=1 Tax=Kingdonia uniflora TaxID=39325 RepID=A0A7J7PAR6_9MAGN|nr:hypothetical protein GIB67_007900 [Kingdonia uniflora]